MAAAMENGALNGGAVHTNHDRDRDGKLGSPKVNGVNGVVSNTTSGAKMANGDTSSTAAEASSSRSLRMNDLPDEIQHITTNYVPLGFLLQRLAQKTHNNLQDLIRELARKPVAGSGSTGSGSSAVSAPPPLPPGTDDGSIENIEKKKALLDFARSEHANWVKALVITEWSKKASQISKLIDLENHMFEEELVRYEQAVFTMLNLKRNLNDARVPSPDLKTALNVLSRGAAGWMPDLGFLSVPPLNAQEQLKHLDNISTLLSLRLNLEDHDTIPYHFRHNNYTIASGRVTFRVPGEFEVDLTLASDDFTQQLWFLDLRFLFSPSPRDLTPGLRKALEDRVNNVLAQEGLPGCYRMLHEYVLTHKINELRRQVRDLARGRWIDTVRVEQLNRAIAVQYWTSRHNGGNGSSQGSGPTSSATSQALRSWFIIGVHSGRDSASVDMPEEQITSRLSLRWFRDNKEVKDLNDEQVSSLLASIVSESGEGDEINTNAVTLSAETILQRVVALHVEHILSGIHAKLAAKPLFAKRLASMRLRISRIDASASFLEIQLTNAGDRIWVRIDPVTGLFSLSPQQSRIISHSEMRINAVTAGGGPSHAGGGGANAAIDPVEEGFAILDSVRNLAAQESLGRRAKSSGWRLTRNAGPAGGPLVRTDDLRQLLNLRDSYQVLYLHRAEWTNIGWYVLAGLSLSGDRWWLVRLDDPQPPGPPLAPGQPPSTSGGYRIAMQMLLPLGGSPADLDDNFFSDLTIYATGVLAQYTDSRELASRHKSAQATRITNPYLPTRAKLPAMSIRLVDLLAGGPGSGSGSGAGAGAASASSAAAINRAVLPLDNQATSLASATATRRWWDDEYVRVLFRGVDMDGSEEAGNDIKDKDNKDSKEAKEIQHRMGVLAEARLTVLDRSKFRLLGNSTRSDQDVAFNSRTGQFCLYLRAAVGESVIDTLVRRLRSIERLVGFLDAIRRESRVVHSQTVTLSRLVFSYSVGPGNPLSPEEQENLTTEAAVASAAAAASCGRWRVSVDLSSSAQVHLQLERGCPHLRVADFLNNVANDPTTFAAVPFFLTATLSLHRALDRMEDAWESVQMRNAGMLGIFPRSLDWIVVRFLIPPDPPGAHARPRLLVLDLRLRTRRGELLWQIRRIDNNLPESTGAAANTVASMVADDDLAKVMRRVFEGSGPGWRGLLTAAVASPYPPKNPEEASAAAAAVSAAASGMARPAKTSAGSTGIEDCLLQIDESVRALLSSNSYAPSSSSTTSNAQQQQRRAQNAAQSSNNNAIPQAQTARMS
ncbi:mediator complex subunit [Sporothrix bragantina]|uniref:Mediator of RNA polymerase II transcription subunit 14 n=1 Tax=Sporothrix bragantina TaxID=671064 RepID=A0ABP0B5E0_9PEZI